MRKGLLLLIALFAAVAMAGSAYSQVRDQPIEPPAQTPPWAGTTDIFWKFAENQPGVIYPLRLGIIAYCADLYHNAGDVGLQPGRPFGSGRRFFDYLGQYGAQNLVDYFGYDDNIDRIRDAQIIDGDLVLPTGTQLIQNFDIVIAYTDNKCGQPIPVNIANSASKALTDFIAAPGKKLILTGFAFSSSIGFGNGIFGAGLSPLTKGGPGLAPCRRTAAGGPACQIGSCAPPVCPPTGPNGLSCTATGTQCLEVNLDGTTGADCGLCTAQQPAPGEPALCRDATNTVTCGNPNYQPLLNNADLACDQMLPSVKGPTSSSWATNLTAANVARGATLCFNYEAPFNTIPFLAINAARNIIAINSFPPDRDDIVKFWYGCLLGNAVEYLSGNTKRCTTPLCR